MGSPNIPRDPIPHTHHTRTARSLLRVSNSIGVNDLSSRFHTVASWGRSRRKWLARDRNRRSARDDSIVGNWAPTASRSGRTRPSSASNSDETAMVCVWSAPSWSMAAGRSTATTLEPVLYDGWHANHTNHTEHAAKDHVSAQRPHNNSGAVSTTRYLPGSVHSREKYSIATTRTRSTGDVDSAATRSRTGLAWSA